MKIRRRNFSSIARRYDRARGVVVSIPKSGRTWLRVFLHAYCCMLAKREFTLDAHEIAASQMPEFVFTHDLWQHLKTDRLKAHFRGKHLVPPRAVETKPILLLARDPRDVVVSLFFELSRRTGQFHGTLSEIVADPRFGIGSIVEIMNTWIAEWGERSNFLLLRYEDCRRNTRDIFVAMLAFFGFTEIDDEALDRSLEFSSFENMKAMEANKTFTTEILLPRDAGDPDSFKVRRGIVGGYTQYLSAPAMAYIELALANLDPRFGYHPTPAPAHSRIGCPTVAMFQKPDVDHWGPPSQLAQTIYKRGGCAVKDALRMCLSELGRVLAPTRGLNNDARLKSSPFLLRAKMKRTRRRLELSCFSQGLYFFSRGAQVLFFLFLLVYAWFFPPSGLFEEGTWTEALTDTIGIAGVVFGSLLRLWAKSHCGSWNVSQRHKVPTLITQGPYAYMRHPMYMGSIVLGIGMIFLSEAFVLIPVFLVLVALSHLFTISAEESFMQERVGEGYDLYSQLVPKYFPRLWPDWSRLSLGTYFSFHELARACVICLAAFFVEWIESPLHRRLLSAVYHWVRP